MLEIKEFLPFGELRPGGGNPLLFICGNISTEKSG